MTYLFTLFFRLTLNLRSNRHNTRRRTVSTSTCNASRLSFAQQDARDIWSVSSHSVVYSLGTETLICLSMFHSANLLDPSCTPSLQFCHTGDSNNFNATLPSKAEFPSRDIWQVLVYFTMHLISGGEESTFSWRRERYHEDIIGYDDAISSDFVHLTTDPRNWAYRDSWS